jgi:putative flippase GtrA
MAVQAPDRKITVGLVAGSVMTILAWTSKQYAGVEIPAEVALAGATVITFILQYMVPNAPEDQSNA